MPDFVLRMTKPKTISKAKARSTFYWTPSGGDSFIRTFGPALGGIGPVAPLNIDLVRIAVAVYAADRSTVRAAGGSNWSRREFTLSVPVSDPARWEAVAGRLSDVLGFLTGDVWTLNFTSARKPKEAVAEASPRPARVVLLSGGADSAVGALVSRHELGDEPHALVSHFSANFLPSIQRSIVEQIAELVRGPEQRHCVIRFTRRKTQPNGTRFADDYSTRSRSLLFIALGLAVASVHQVPLWVPENGFASLNPPLGADRRGSLSTRTTHPYYLDRLRNALRDAGVHADFSNPFQSLTKGEIFARAAEIAGSTNASSLLSPTLSCAHTGHKTHGYSITVGCGVCFGCLVRKAAFAASEIEDRSQYLPRSDSKLSHYLADKSAERALELFLEHGVGPADVAAMSLPNGYRQVDALDLCRRAVDELRLLFA